MPREALTNQGEGTHVKARCRTGGCLRHRVAREPCATKRGDQFAAARIDGRARPAGSASMLKMRL